LAQAQADQAITERRHRARAGSWLADRPDETVATLLAEHTRTGTAMVLELLGGRMVVGCCRWLGLDFAVLGTGPRWHLIRLAALTQIRRSRPIGAPDGAQPDGEPGSVVMLGATAWLADRLQDRLEVMVWTTGSAARGTVVACSEELLTIACPDGSRSWVPWTAITDIAEQ
jgi:hypothetical protein